MWGSGTPTDSVGQAAYLYLVRECSNMYDPCFKREKVDTRQRLYDVLSYTLCGAGTRDETEN